MCWIHLNAAVFFLTMAMENFDFDQFSLLYSFLSYRVKKCVGLGMALVLVHS